MMVLFWYLVWCQREIGHSVHDVRIRQVVQPINHNKKYNTDVTFITFSCPNMSCFK